MPGPDQAPTVPLVGRDGVLAAISGRLAALASGRSQVVLIEGEPGIGKTRVLDEAMRRAKPATVVRARGDALDCRRPFGLLADAFRCRRSSADAVRSEIARLLADGASEHQILDRFAELVESMALAGPVVCGLDDLQWADASTLVAVRYLTRHLDDVPFVVVGAYRPVPANPELGRLVDGAVADGALHVELGPLTKDEVTELVAAFGAATASRELMEQVAKATGNPFYVLELLHAMRESSDALPHRIDGVDGHRPSVVQLSLVRSLRFLSPPSIELLRTAAVLGTTFGVADLLAAMATDVSTALPMLQEALRAGLLTETGDRLAFRHDLIREALYGDTPLSVRRVLHRQAGRALARVDAPATVVAEHLLAAGGPLLEEDLTPLVVAAARVANRSARADLLLRVLELLPAPHARRPEVAASAIETLALAGRGSESDELARRELTRVDAEGEPTIRLGIVRSLHDRNIAAGVLEHLGWLRDHTEVAAGIRAELAGREGLMRIAAGDIGAAAIAASDAVEMGHRTRSSAGIVIGLQAQCVLAMIQGRGREAVARGQEAVRAERGTDADSEFVLATALLGEDRFDELDAVCAAGEQRCAETGRANGLPFYHGVRGVRLHAAGALDDAVANVEAVADLVDDLQGDWEALARSLQARVAIHQGDLGTARRQIDDASASFRGMAAGVEWVGWVSALTLEAEGRTDDAAQLLNALWDAAPAFRLVPTLAPAAIDVIRMALAAGDRARMTGVAEVLAVGAAGSDAPSTHGAAHLTRALCDRDAELVRRAIATYASGPRILATAQARELAADLLPSDEAVSELRLAANAYEAAGAIYDLSRVAATLRSRGARLGARGRRQRPATGWESLTPSERKVVELAAEGLTTRAIGERLFVSVNTVETHLRHAYQKLSIGSRAELATVAAHHRGPA